MKNFDVHKGGGSDVVHNQGFWGRGVHGWVTVVHKSVMSHSRLRRYTQSTPTPRIRPCLAAVPGMASRARTPLALLTSGLAWGPSGAGSLAPHALLTGYPQPMMRGELLAPMVPLLWGSRVER